MAENTDFGGTGRSGNRFDISFLIGAEELLKEVRIAGRRRSERVCRKIVLGAPDIFIERLRGWLTPGKRAPEQGARKEKKGKETEQ
jgi:hypothetical protein